MPKFDFNSSRYAKFFADRSNRRFLQTFIDTEGILYTNYGWHLTQGRPANAPTPTDSSGVATFTVKARKVEAAPLMDLRAPLGDSNQMDKEGLSFYSATIPDFIAPGWVETAMEREYRIRQFELFGSDADIVGRGIKTPLHKAAIPEENFVKAGALVWTDSSCKLLEQMKHIEDTYREKRNYTGSLIWQVPRKMYYEVILENAQVKELIADYRKNPLAYQATTEGQSFTEFAFRQAVIDYQGVSPIEVVTEKERNKTHTTDTFIHGWKENVAVLRPAGDAVEFEYTENLDQRMFQRYGSKAISKVFAQTNDGLATL